MCLKCLAFTLLPLIFFHYRPNNSYVDIVKVMGRGLLLEDETCENYDYPCFWGVCVCACVCVCAHTSASMCVCMRVLNISYAKRSRRVTGMNKTQFHFPGVNNLVKLETDTKVTIFQKLLTQLPEGSGRLVEVDDMDQVG